ncbi:MAG TPA: hypothetical protein VGG27_13390 [Magnetospirillaceae bacterium]|jgi:hypothetical protein
MIKTLSVAAVAFLGTVPAFPAMAMEPVMDVFVENPLQPIFRGSTNLPDGTQLMLTLSRPASSYMGQTNMTVKDGHFTTEQFSADGHPLNAGVYEIEITMTMAAMQPKQVQDVIGKEGENLKGRYAKPGILGGITFDYAVQKQLGGPPNAALDAAARAKTKEDLQKWIVESCNSNVDFVNAAVRAGVVTGHEIKGEERQSNIAACIAYVSKDVH